MPTLFIVNKSVGFLGLIFILYVCISNMGTQKQRQERLSLLAEKWKKNQKDGIAEVVNRKLIDDFMIQVWFLGHQTRQDYLLVLSSLDYRRAGP